MLREGATHDPWVMERTYVPPGMLRGVQVQACPAWLACGHQPVVQCDRRASGLVYDSLARVITGCKAFGSPFMSLIVTG